MQPQPDLSWVQVDNESIRVATDADWHELRRRHIGGSEAAILLGVEKYMTRYELFHLKAGRLADADLDGERVVIGTHLEAGIIAAAREIHGTTLRQVRRYVRRTDVPGMGASMDAEENHPDVKGWVPVDAKNVGWDVWSDQWAPQEDGDEIRVPLHISIQMQHYMAVTGAPLAVLYVLVAGTKIHRIEVRRHERVIELLEQAIALFWQEIEAGVEPSPDFTADLDAMCRVMTNTLGDTEHDLTLDPVLALLMDEYREANAARKAAEDRVESVKARALQRLGEIEVALVDGGKITAKLSPPRPEETKQITYKAQPAKRSLRFYPSRKRSA